MGVGRFAGEISGLGGYRRWGLLAAVLAGTLVAGCERPSLPPDPGQIVFEIPKVEGTEKPYPLEPLGPPSQEALEQLRLP